MTFWIKILGGKDILMKLIILDRDGVINQDSDEYIKSPEEFIPIPGSLDAIARLNRAGYTVVVATNQSGVARGLYDESMLAQMHKKLARLLIEKGGRIDGIYYCPHGPEDNCDCRKPKTGLLNQIAEQTGAELRGVYAVGDSLRDIQAAQKVDARPVLVKTGKGIRTLSAGSPDLVNVPVYDDLATFVDDLTEKES